MDVLESQVEGVFVVSPDIELLGLLMCETQDVRRRVRAGVHMLLERAEGLGQFLTELDELAIWCCQHGDTAAGSVLLAWSDAIRNEVAQ
jgi:hypothetical protein